MTNMASKKSNNVSEQTNDEQTSEQAHEEGNTSWVRIVTDRPLYSGDRGRGDTVQGYLVALQSMPPNAEGKPWRAFIVKLTAPCRVKKGQEVIVAAPGTEILVPANYNLERHLASAAMHPRCTFEVRIKPTGQSKSSKGSVTNYEMDVNPTPRPRDAESRLLAMQAQTSGQLTQGSGYNAETGEVA